MRIFRKASKINDFQITVVSTSRLARKSFNLRCGWVSVRTYNVIMCGISFCILFTSITPNQNLQSTLNRSYGLYSLGILNLALAISCFVAPLLVIKMGEKVSMILGTVGYVFWLAMNIVYKINSLSWLLIFSSTIAGFGAGILWTAQASFIAKNSTQETLGLNSGIFFGFYQINQIIGNLIAARIVIPLKSNDFGNSTIFIIFTCIALVALLSFLFLRPIPNTDDMIEAPLYHLTVLLRVKKMFNLLSSQKFRYLILITIYSGLSQSFFTGMFTSWIGRAYLNYVMLVFGIADALGSFFFGKIIDVLGRKSVLLISSVLAVIGAIFLCSFSKDYLESHKIVYYVSAISLGLSDGGILTMLYATFGNIFISDIEIAFASFRFVQCSISGIYFFITVFFHNFYEHLLVVIFSLCTGLLSYLILDFFVVSVDDVADESFLERSDL